MQTDFLILGGGIAGLSAANELADLGANVTLLESGTYPSHKVCGEFISPEAVPLLEKWEIDLPIKIHHVKFISSQKEWSMELPEAAASLSRYILDEALAKRASKKGAIVQTGAQVKHIEFPKGTEPSYVVTLSSGEKWSSPTLLISTGRLVSSLMGQSQVPHRYIGVKAHFEGVHIPDLVMHLSKGAYFGVSPIARDRVNVAGIMTATPQQILNPQQTFDAFLKSTAALPLLKTLESHHIVFNSWMVGSVPEFGVRKHPAWPNVFLLGDAAGVIPPATGNGLAMGLTSGILAATYAFKREDKAYKKHWDSLYKARISKGKLLHRLFLSPLGVKAIPILSKIFPRLPHYCFKATRG